VISDPMYGLETTKDPVSGLGLFMFFPEVTKLLERFGAKLINL